MKIVRKRLIVWGIFIILVLMIPFIAMRFSDEIKWDLFDFVIMGAILFGIAVSYEIIARKSKKTVYRIAFGTGLVGAFLLFWVNGAVGIIGSEEQNANLLYGAVFVVGLVGSLIAKFKPKGMFNTLIAATVIQMLVPVIALIFWPPTTISWSPGVFFVFLISAFFAVFFLISALLFRRAAANDNFTL